MILPIVELIEWLIARQGGIELIIYDINKKTGALILGKNRLDDYATKYLTKHCKEALLTPMPLPVEKILEDAKLTVKEVSLSRNLEINNFLNEGNSDERKQI